MNSGDRYLSTFASSRQWVICECLAPSPLRRAGCDTWQRQCRHKTCPATVYNYNPRGIELPRKGDPVPHPAPMTTGLNKAVTLDLSTAFATRRPPSLPKKIVLVMKTAMSREFFIALMMETISASETSVTLYQTTRCYILISIKSRQRSLFLRSALILSVSLRLCLLDRIPPSAYSFLQENVLFCLSLLHLELRSHSMIK